MLGYYRFTSLKIKYSLIGIFIIYLSSTCLSTSIDVLPLGFMGDANTPYAIHFNWDSSAFLGYSHISAKIRMQSGGSNANNLTWSIINPSGWRSDSIGFATLQPLTITGSTASGWLFAKSTSRAYFGTSTCTIRARRGGSNTNYDLTEPATIYSWNSTNQAGWLDGVFSSLTNTIVLAMDGSNQILGSYISEPNGINEGYSNQPGYFKMAVPIGSIDHLEFRNLDNQVIYIKNGPWTITPNTTTTIPEPSSIPLFYWTFY